MKKLTLIMLLLCAMCISARAQAEENNSDQGLGYICEGTQWVMNAMVMTEPFKLEMLTIHNWIEGTEFINGKTYMVVWGDKCEDHSYREIIGYLRTENEKVYFIHAAYEESEEVLMFDYTITEGEATSFVPLVRGDIPWGLQNTAILCNAIGTEEGENESFPSMTVEYFEDGESMQPLVQPIKWIRGIGGEAGIYSNFASAKSGLLSVSEVYHDGILVYKAQNGGAGVESVADDAAERGLAGRRYHPDGREFRDGDSGICIENGRKTIR